MSTGAGPSTVSGTRSRKSRVDVGLLSGATDANISWLLLFGTLTLRTSTLVGFGSNDALIFFEALSEKALVRAEISVRGLDRGQECQVRSEDLGSWMEFLWYTV